MKKPVMLLVAAALVAGLVGCTTTQPGQTAVLVDSWGAPEVSGCVPPESMEFTPFSDAKEYPSRQITWDALNTQDAEAEPTLVVSNASAPAELRVPYTITFDLTNNCDDLKQFYRDFGSKFQGDNGWSDLLRQYVGLPSQNTIVSIAQKYTWREIWNDEKVRAEFQAALTTQLPKITQAKTNNKEYFNNFQVTVYKPDLVDQGLKDAITNEQKSIADAKATEAKGVADANAAKAQAEAEIASTQAKTEVARQEALQLQATISGYGEGPEAVANYLRALAIKQNINPYPAPILPVASR